MLPIPKRGNARNDSRERILRVSAELFRELGYHGTSIHDISTRMGMVKSALYHHFTGKEQILAEILERGLDDLLTPLEEIRASQLPPMEKLRAALVHQLKSVTEGIDATAAAVALREPRSLSREVREGFITRRDRAEKIFRDIIAEGVKEGVFRPVDPKMLTFALLGMCNWAARWYSPQGTLSSQEIGDLFFDYIMHGALPQPMHRTSS